MSTAFREQGIETIHDRVVSLVAQRWAKAFHGKITIHTSLEQDPWPTLGSRAISPDGR
ncbi:MAG: hypothetical protein RL042_1806 [Nitrospirota bacterium]|jgi:hypothetical protein